MRLYLSSFRLGHRPEEFVALFHQNRKVALIANADDYKGREARTEGVERELRELGKIGLEPFELDLRQHFGDDPREVRRLLEECGGVWVRGGNSFVLRRAMRLCGADEILVDLVNRDAIAYGGYSAGVCVLPASMRGLEGADDARLVPSGYERLPEPVFEGLALIPYSIVPHVPREGDPEPWIASIVDAFERAGVPYRNLADGEAIVHRDGDEHLVG